MKGCTVVILVAVVCLIIAWWWVSCRNKESFAGEGKGYWEITWDAPTFTGGADITGYGVTITDKDGTVVDNAKVSDTKYDFGKDDSPTNPVGKWNTDYTVSVVSLNSVGQSTPATTTFNSGSVPVTGDVTFQYWHTDSKGVTSKPVYDDDYSGNLSIVATVPGIDGSSTMTSELTLVRGSTKCTSNIQSMQYDDTDKVWKPPKNFLIQPGCANNPGGLLVGDILEATIYVSNQYGTTTYTDTKGYTVGPTNPNPPTNLTVKWVSPS